tara:strand:- start:78 stop:872 length:795 start_codon:yes stop_codon:yes gene_type:complete
MEKFNLGWIKIHRSILDWEWYTDVNVRLTFMHFLMKANYEDKKWKGIHIPRGSFISSISHLSAEIGISVRQVRTAIKKLKATNEITSQSSASNTMITIVSYDDYQQFDKPDDKRMTNQRQTSDKRATTTKEVKNIKSKEYKKLLLSELSVTDVDKENYLLMAQAFQELFKANVISAGGSSTAIDKAKGTWYDDIRKLVEIDKVEMESIRKVFIFLKSDPFWKKNILSTSKLRDKFNKLILNANNAPAKRNITREEFEQSIDKHF